jgi:hypothetical protein
MKLKDLLRDVRGKKPTDEVYVDGAQLPAEPEGPYRARMAEAKHHPAPRGIDVSEPEVVTGQLQLLYRIHCPCGHQWDTTDFQRVSLCGKCDRAVLVELPQLPVE